MKRIRTGFQFMGSIALIIALLTGDALADKLQNPGFEDGVQYWDIVASADSVEVVDKGEADLPVYADVEPSVIPYRGDRMLRLGMPNEQNEKQEWGDNTVTQSFTPTGGMHTFAFRLFSWDHRQDDLLRFGINTSGAGEFPILDAGGNPLTISVGGESPQTCAPTLCEILVGDGNQQGLVDTGWVLVTISNLPESPLTLEYTLAGGQNKAHPSWVYFDSVNTPPVAKFSFNNKGRLDAQDNRVDLVEGAHVNFIDESYDPDPGDSVVDWEWWISGSDYYDANVIVREKNPTFIFPDNIAGEVVINLRVTDSFGASTMVSSGGELLESDGTTTRIAGLTVSNNEALVRVLNQEVLAGGETQLFGRFIDPGFLDSHTATWNVNGVGTTGEVTESNGIPSASIGTVTADFIAPDSSGSISNASLTVSDGSDSATESFIIEVLDLLDLDPREPNDDLSSPPPTLDSGWVYLSTLDSVGDVDIFEVLLPGEIDKDLPAGSEILVKLKDLPADYDLVVLSYLPTDTSTSTTPWLQTPWLQTPWLQTPWLQTPWLQTPWLQTPWLQTPWLQTPWLQTPWLQTPWLQTSFVEQIPLSDLAQAELGGEIIGGSDLSLSEIGLDPVAGLSVAGFSANRGIVNETVMVRTDLPGTRIYVAVIGNNGAYSLDPYALQIETSKPLELDILLGAECAGEPLIAEPHAATSLGGSASPRVLFVTQQQRFDAINGTGSWDSVAASLANLQEDFAVLNIASSVYDAWDNNPCSVEEANNVSSFIREQIVNELSKPDSSVEFVVFIGGDDIIPFRRVPDETTISSEKLYVQDSHLKPGSPQFASMYQGNNLTDDYYVDNQPINWQGRELYVPKLPVSRLVETPSEIIASIDAYLVSSQIRTSSALVTGYDFFVDGSELSALNLGSIASVTELIDQEWDLAQLRCELLGVDAYGNACGTSNNGINNVNAHFNHYGAISAYGYNNGVNEDFLSSLDIYDSGSALTGDLTYTIGCHSGLNVPDGSAYLTSALGSVDPNLDFPQAMSSRGSVYVGSTGFGLGDDVTIAGTEKLIALFSAELSNSATVGEALVKAKQSYINGLSTITVYDEKSSIQTAMYGLPMYELANDEAAGGIAAAAQAPQVLQSETLDFLHVKSTTEDGSSYFTVNGKGEYQATAWRPLQPKVVMNLPGTDQAPRARGVLITAGEYEDFPDFDPVITKPTQEWEQSNSEPGICLDAYWPSSIASINSQSLLGNIQQYLVLVPGQFRCTSREAAVVSGIQRNITSLSYELTAPAMEEDSDFVPPTIKEVDLHYVDATSIRVGLLASDDTGIDRIVLLVFQGGMIQSIEGVVSSPDAGYYTVDNVPFSEEAQLLLQVVDGSGNVANWSAKGTTAKVLEVYARGDMISTLSPTTLTGTIADFDDLVEENNELRENDVFYRWEFGDGHTEFGKLVEDGVPVYDPSELTTDDAGRTMYSFTVQHQYQYAGFDELTAVLKVTDSTGAIGVDDYTMRFCADPMGDVYGAASYLDFTGCDTASDGSEITIKLQTADLVGDNQFRVHLDLDSDGKDDEMLKYNDGAVTGMKGLQVTAEDQVVTFIFNLPKRSWNGESFQWYAETQDGVSGGAGQGFVDRMPDAGYFTHTTTQ